MSDIKPATMTEEQAATYIGIGIDLLRRLRMEGDIPHIRLGDRVLYYPPCLDEYLRRKSESSIGMPGGMRRIPA